jgi:hypothetical protein
MECFKCGGKGKISGFEHIANGDCFQCGGSGKLANNKRRKIAADPHPELLVPEAERSTTKQWDYLVTLCDDNDEMICRVLRDAGAPMATQRYTTRAVMSRAIEGASKL